MKKKTESVQVLGKEIWSFIVHLRWHYQVGILSGGFLLGGFLSASMHWQNFLIQFINVHLLLFGGATAYNSFWDKDEGPVGGLKHPPEMSDWMHQASILLQIFGLFLVFRAGLPFALVYLVSMLFFWLYSTPLFRWKGSPVKSLFAIGISTGFNSVLLGYLAAGGSALNTKLVPAAAGVMLIILSLYPASQLYQVKSDLKRGDQTFAAVYGFDTVLSFYFITFVAGLILIALSILQIKFWYGILFFLIGTVVWISVYYRLKKISGKKQHYQQIMRIKYGTSFAFVSFLIFLLFVRHI